LIQFWQKQAPIYEVVFAVVALMFMTDTMLPFIAMTKSQDADPNSANVLYQALGLGILGGASVFMLPRLLHAASLCARNIPILLVVMLTLVSLVWSVEPDLTFRRAVSFTATTIVAVYLATRFPPDQFLRLFAVAVGIGVIASLVTVVVMPDIGLHPRGGHLDNAWRGVYGHRNRMGRVLALGAVAFLVLAIEADRRRRLLHFCMVAGCLFLIVMGGSRTAWITSTLTVGGLAAFILYRRVHYSISFPVIMIGAILVGAAAVFIFTNLGTATEAIGRDASLSGRTRIWQVVFEGANRPMLGYGFEAFWDSPIAAAILARQNVINFDPGNAHNGWIQIWLDFGFLGVGLVLLVLMNSLYRLYRWIVYAPNQLGLWLPGIYIFAFFQSLPGSFIAAQSFVWVSFVMMTMYLTMPPVPEPVQRPARDTALQRA
jgi:O-antigen ligase